ncbi:MAG: HDIG domain-containing metalloprotein [Eubacteriales bacterium]
MDQRMNKNLEDQYRKNIGVKLELFNQMNTHLLRDEEPSQYFNGLPDDIMQEGPFNLLYQLKKTQQSKKHHPEGNVWNHTMLVIDAAAKRKSKSNDARALMWAALLHDIGKPATTRKRNGKITSYNHESVGANIAKEFLLEFVHDLDLLKTVVSLIRWHMQVLYVLNHLPFADIHTMKKEVDVEELALLGYCDRLGRLGANMMQEEKEIQTFIERCRK